jgi:hypothetical protein
LFRFLFLRFGVIRLVGFGSFGVFGIIFGGFGVIFRGFRFVIRGICFFIFRMRVSFSSDQA